jgi:hypothetical protein
MVGMAAACSARCAAVVRPAGCVTVNDETELLSSRCFGVAEVGSEEYGNKTPL